jgi:hypothetical protein
MIDLDRVGIAIRRDTRISLYPFTDFFKGFEKVSGIRSLFGEKTSEILANLKVEFYSAKFGYMSVSDEDGHLLISAHHLKNAAPEVLYLDVFHELHHVKQFFDGKELFSMEFDYVDNPVEVEAYKATVQEAKRLGMSEEQIIEYLRVEWITEEQLERLVRAVGVTTVAKKKKNRTGK